MDQAALTDQKALISFNLQTLAGGLKYQYEEGQAGQLNVFDLETYGATANMDIRTQNGSDGDDAHMLVIQFASPEQAAAFAAQGRDEWPIGNETTPIGNHRLQPARLHTGFNRDVRQDARVRPGSV